MKKTIVLIMTFIVAVTTMSGQSWTADNGNGTYTNPLFYDEFSDPDIIRAGSDFYLVGTSMHSVPGLAVLHSKDLVNWSFLGYALNRLDNLDEFNLMNGKDSYGQGIWAPCIRYHNGKFYIFSHINHHGVHVFIASNPSGPWIHKDMGGNIHDLSILFDGSKIYAVYGYDEVRMIEVKPDFTGYVEGTDRVIIPRGNAMGEGHHVYKIDGKYYIISADYSPMGRMQCARADKLEGPYETAVISARETMGTQQATWVNNVGQNATKYDEEGMPFIISKPLKDVMNCATLHQGGIVDLPNGDWWGWSMQDFRSEGRTTCLSPVTWIDGWPYFGLAGNLGRSPRTWIKPDVGEFEKPHATYRRSDDFSGKPLQPIWQWNHNPDDSRWSLTNGRLRLNTMPAANFLRARNTLTQRGIGPASSATVTLDASHLKNGDIAGLGLLNVPCVWMGVLREGKHFVLRYYNQLDNEKIDIALDGGKVYLRATGYFDTDSAQMSYSIDGKVFTDMGEKAVIPYQLKTFQGTRYALFAFNTEDVCGGFAEFDDFIVSEPYADRSANLPIGKVITLLNMGNNQRMWANPHGMLHGKSLDEKEYDATGCRFRVIDRGRGRVALEAMNGTGFVTVVGAGLSADVRLMKKETEGSLFQWQDMLMGECMLLSLKTNRYVGIDPATGEPYGADWTGASPGRTNGTVFKWHEAE